MIGDVALPEGVIMLPVKKRKENIVLSSGAQLAGIRFHPAIAYGVLDCHYNKPTLLQSEDDQLYHFYQIFSELCMISGNAAKVEALNRWVEESLDFTQVIPDPLEKALDSIKEIKTLGNISDSTALSQRQIERYFKRWLGMTPKQYQRILRVKRATHFLRIHKHANLAHVAQQFGFSDQAHMTREFRTIACMTPRSVC